MQFKVIQFAIFFLGCQFLCAQEAKIKNPILTDKFIISAGLYSPLNNVKLSANGTASARESRQIDFDKHFNIADYQNTFSMNFTWRFAKNWNVSADFFRIKRENQVVFEDDIQWKNVTFKQGTGVEGGFGFSLYRVFFGRVIARGNQYELGGGLGAHIITIFPFIEGQAYINDNDFEFKRHEVSSTLPLPNIGIWFIYAPIQKLSLTTKLDWFGIKIDNFSGVLWDISPTINYQAFRNLGISAGYKFLDFGVEVDKNKWQGNIDLQFQGPTVSVFGNF
ncbi:hypothetical protein EI546_01110 [Aequorivita sp. H23M31]|uniref:DUF481 domain-containing protein n=1 Tax=Aequorivita ciconiae TaxID=2494375 RepID=A0A410FZK4_9FLAO|nr:hypothetical protein [Aequorivita sp. H23M31]QAA80413.1 hypothetical protein EI546_01110 [Aequorivita sp. H23M31]